MSAMIRMAILVQDLMKELGLDWRTEISLAYSRDRFMASELVVGGQPRLDFSADDSRKN